MKKLITKALAITLSSFILGANLLYAQDVNKPTDSITEEYDENGRLQAEVKYTVVVIEIGEKKYQIMLELAAGIIFIQMAKYPSR